MTPSRLLDARAAAAYLTVTVPTLRELTRRGEIRCLRVSPRNTRWHVDDLDVFVEQLRGNPI